MTINPPKVHKTMAFAGYKQKTNKQTQTDRQNKKSKLIQIENHQTSKNYS